MMRYVFFLNDFDLLYLRFDDNKLWRLETDNFDEKLLLSTFSNTDNNNGHKCGVFFYLIIQGDESNTKQVCALVVCCILILILISLFDFVEWWFCLSVLLLNYVSEWLIDWLSIWSCMLWKYPDAHYIKIILIDAVWFLFFFYCVLYCKLYSWAHGRFFCCGFCVFFFLNSKKEDK